MTIQDEILKPYEIHFDGLQYTLVENCVSKSGSPYNVTHGYYVDIAYAVKKICELEISKKEDLSLQGFIAEWKALQEKFKPLFYAN